MVVGADPVRVDSLANRIRGEYREMPGLCLTKPQMQRLWSLGDFICDVLVDALVLARVLRRTADGAFVAFHSAH